MSNTVNKQVHIHLCDSAFIIGLFQKKKNHNKATNNHNKVDKTFWHQD